MKTIVLLIPSNLRFRKLRKYYLATPSLTFSYSKETFEKNLGAMLETYVVNLLNASHYYREGKKEIDIVLKDGELLPIEVKEHVGEEDLRKFSNLVKHINAKRGTIVSLNQEMKRPEVEVIPIYLVEKKLCILS